MAKPLPPDDFRSKVWLLEPDDFALSDGTPEPPPSDLIPESTWDSIQTLPQDVSVRTSNRHGGLLTLMDDLWDAWLEAIDLDDPSAPISVTTIDVIDEFQACVFNALHGFYRQAIACLRNVVELVTVGAYCELCGSQVEFEEWRDGNREIRFDAACAGLTAHRLTQPLDAHLRSTLTDSMFDQRRGTNQGGWARRLYAKLCKYAHSAPSFTNADLWQSNGPIYVEEAFHETASLYLETLAYCFTIVKLVRPSFVLPESAEQLYMSDRVVTPRITQEAYEYLFANTQQHSNGEVTSDAASENSPTTS